MSATDWLKRKHLLADEPSLSEIKSGLAWMRRHFNRVRIITMRKGYWLVSASPPLGGEADKLYKICSAFGGKAGLPYTVRNKSRAAKLIPPQKGGMHIPPV